MLRRRIGRCGLSWYRRWRIALAVRVALLRALGREVRHIRVFIDGRSVILEGVMPTGMQAETAARVARGVPGVAGVWNRLATSQGILPCRADDCLDLAEAVLHALRREAVLSADAIEAVEEAPGVIVLLGVVPSSLHRDLADLLTRNYAGVRAVRNDLRYGAEADF